ncbi:MAG: FtsW/RodA/SpoVE family cell cycle protein [Clostridia bacterium]|nr:FtsW/RodA/SpoVE family cell cycle protein [Clostridia bacterium]
MKKKASGRLRFSAAAVLLSALVFLVPALLRNGADPALLYLLAALIPCAMLLCETVLARMFALDRMIMSLSLWLCAAGIAALAMSDADAALAQSLRCGAAVIALLIGGIIIRSLSPSLLTSACTAFLGLLILAGRLFSPSLNLRLNEAALALLLIAFASLLARQGPVSALLLGGAALALLLLGRDYANALFWGLTVLLLVFSADGRLMIIFPAFAAVLLSCFGVYLLSPSGTFQSFSPVSILVSVGWTGADTLPDVFAALDHESLFLSLAGHFGLVFAGLTALLFLPLSLRGNAIAAFARTRFHAVLAMGAVLLLALHVLTALLSLFGFIPLPGLRLPFLTRSLTDLCAETFLAGLLCGVSGRNDADLAEDAHLAMLAK